MSVSLRITLLSQLAIGFLITIPTFRVLEHAILGWFPISGIPKMNKTWLPSSQNESPILNKTYCSFLLVLFIYEMINKTVNIL